jgi:hypothetical protein
MQEAGLPTASSGRPRRQGDGRRDPRRATSRRSASSARPTSRNISTAAAPRTGSGCRRSAAPRTTASSCPTPISTGGERPCRRRLRLGGERCMALPVVVPVGEKTAVNLREKLIRRSRRCASACRPIPRPIMARWSTPRIAAASRTISDVRGRRRRAGGRRARLHAAGA